MNGKVNTARPRILLVGLPHNLPHTDWADFYSDTHFLDYDVVIIDPHGAIEGPNHKYMVGQGVLTLKRDDGVAYFQRFKRVSQKLDDFVNRGGLAIVFLRAMPRLEYPLPGNVAQIVRKNLDEFLPWKVNPVHKARGINIEFGTQGPIGHFWASTEGLWRYEAVYNNAPRKAEIAHVRGHPDEVVADIVMSQARGFTFVTPALAYDALRENTRPAMEASERFVKAVWSLHESLRTSGPAPQLPEWASHYHLPGEAELRQEIAAAKARIEALTGQIGQRTEALEKLCLHKLLVTGHDSALEGAVDRILTDLGMKVEPGPKGRVDRTATYGDRKFAVEAQGVKKGAKEDHARALTVWVQEVALRDGKEPKGLLVVNPYRDMPLAERGDKNPWSNDTIKICERQGHCAITGLQLLGLYLDAMADDAKREQLVERMFGTEGIFEGYEDWKQFLAPVEVDAPEQS